MRNPLKIAPFKRDQEVIRQFQPLQDYLAMEAFFEGTEDRIRKLCPNILSFYQRKKKNLLEFVSVDWQSNVIETHWKKNTDGNDVKGRGDLEIEIYDDGMGCKKSDNENNGTIFFLRQDPNNQLFLSDEHQLKKGK